MGLETIRIIEKGWQQIMADSNAIPSRANGDYAAGVAGYGDEQTSQRVNGITDGILSGAVELRKLDIAAYDSIVLQLAREMSRDGKRELMLQRSAKNGERLFHENPIWPGILEAMKRRVDEDR